MSGHEVKLPPGWRREEAEDGWDVYDAGGKWVCGIPKIAKRKPPCVEDLPPEAGPIRFGEGEAEEIFSDFLLLDPSDRTGIEKFIRKYFLLPVGSVSTNWERVLQDICERVPGLLCLVADIVSRMPDRLTEQDRKTIRDLAQVYYRTEPDGTRRKIYCGSPGCELQGVIFGKLQELLIPSVEIGGIHFMTAREYREKWQEVARKRRLLQEVYGRRPEKGVAGT